MCVHVDVPRFYVSYTHTIQERQAFLMIFVEREMASYERLSRWLYKPIDDSMLSISVLSSSNAHCPNLSAELPGISNIICSPPWDCQELEILSNQKRKSQFLIAQLFSNNQVLLSVKVNSHHQLSLAREDGFNGRCGTPTRDALHLLWRTRAFLLSVNIQGRTSPKPMQPHLHRPTTITNHQKSLSTCFRSHDASKFPDVALPGA
jgi:hypothetical protein